MNLAGTRFVSNVELWDEIQNRVRKATRVQAAVAYFGDNGAEDLTSSAVGTAARAG